MQGAVLASEDLKPDDLSDGPVAFQKILDLHCFPEVHRRVKEGYPVSSLADYIQQECKEYLEVTRASLVSILSKYRRSLPPVELAKRIDPAIVEAAVVVEQKLNEVDELDKLYKIQFESVQATANLEKNIGMPVPGLSDKVRVAEGLLLSRIKIRQELGLIKKDLGTIRTQATITTVNVGSAEMNKVLENPKSRNKVLGAVNRFLKNAGQMEGMAISLPDGAEVLVDGDA